MLIASVPAGAWKQELMLELKSCLKAAQAWQSQQILGAFAWPHQYLSVLKRKKVGCQNEGLHGSTSGEP